MTRIRTSHIVVAAVAASCCRRQLRKRGSRRATAAVPHCAPAAVAAAWTTSRRRVEAAPPRRLPHPAAAAVRRRRSRTRPPGWCHCSDGHGDGPARDHCALALPKSEIISGVIVRRGSARSCPTTSTSDGLASAAAPSARARSTRASRPAERTATRSSRRRRTTARPPRITRRGRPAREGDRRHRRRRPGLDQRQMEAGRGSDRRTWSPRLTAKRCPRSTVPTAARITVPAGQDGGVDTAAVAGHDYCYAVFATNGTRFHSARGLSTPSPVAWPWPRPPRPRVVARRRCSARRWPRSWAAVAIAVLLLAALAFVVVKLIRRGPRGRLAVQPDLTSRRPDQHRPV